VAQGHQVVVFEKSRDVGGRAATRRLQGCVVDHGAQYLRLPDDLPDLRRLVLTDLSREGLTTIVHPVWPFERDNHIRPGDVRQHAEPKWTYADGLHMLGRSLATGLEVRLNTRVRQLDRAPGGYRLLDETGTVVGAAERVLVAVPAPQVMDLLQTGAVRGERVDTALTLLGTATYQPMLTFILGYRWPEDGTIFAGGTTSDPRPYYALVNSDREHDISWLAVENDKGRTRAPDDVLVVVAQMAVAFSERYLEAPAEDLLAGLDGQVRGLLAVELGEPLWYDYTRWRYARPTQVLDLAELNRAHDGLCFVGDYTAGWRLHLALQAGLDVAPFVLSPTTSLSPPSDRKGLRR